MEGFYFAKLYYFPGELVEHMTQRGWKLTPNWAGLEISTPRSDDWLSTTYSLQAHLRMFRSDSCAYQAIMCQDASEAPLLLASIDPDVGSCYTSFAQAVLTWKLEHAWSHTDKEAPCSHS